MNIKEIGEIRRRVRRDRCNMTAIYGCYVNGQKEIITSFRQSVGMMPENEAEKYFGMMNRVLSGTIGKNLIDISFQTSQVVSSPEHKFLMDLRNSRLEDESLRMALFQKIIDSVPIDESFVILVGCDSYDVPFKNKDDQTLADASSEVYTYLLCAVCPVKQTKPTLQYISEEKLFHDGGISQVICAPELGFLFPAFDGRATNIYNALYYTHSVKNSYERCVESLFNICPPKPAAEQKKSFESLLARSLDNQCNFQVVQTIHDNICHSIALHQESKVPDTLLITKDEVKAVLKDCGISEPHMAKFSVDFDEAFGFDAQVHPKNIIDNKRFEIKTPDVSIKVNPERSDLIETRIIDGVKYILICADEDVEVNGVSIHISDEELH